MVARSLALMFCALLASVGARAEETHLAVGDPVLAGDPVDPITGWAAEIVPGTPWIRPGPDGSLGTPDDEIDPDVVGDIDLVVRTGRQSFDGEIPDPTGQDGTAPQGVIEPFGRGMPVEFIVVPVDSRGGGPYGSPARPPYLEGLPFFVVAFGDLDGDGFIGITELDGDPLDASVEAAELIPLGRRFALGESGFAAGKLAVMAGGPPGAPLKIALAASAYAGFPEPFYFGGVVPRGPLLVTRMPFLPESNPALLLKTVWYPWQPADPEGRPAIEPRVALAPDPSQAYGEAFTLRLDGSDPTIDLAVAHSGAAVRFGPVRPVDPQRYLPLARRPLRPALDDAGRPIPVEVVSQIVVPDDGAASTTRLRIVALDQLGNVTAPEGKTKVRLKTKGPLRIVSPDEDGKPDREEFYVKDARGIAIVLDDEGGAFDGDDAGQLRVKADERLARIDVFLPDPDVDQDGAVTPADVKAVAAQRARQLGDANFEPTLDQDGNGRIDEADEDAVAAHLGLRMPRDRRGRGRTRGGDCDGKLVAARLAYSGEGCTTSPDEESFCEGDAALRSPVRVVATDEKGKYVWADDLDVETGDEVEISADAADKKNLKKRTILEIRDPTSGELLERSELDTSCKTPLSLGDEHGSLTFVELTSTKGGTLREPEP